MAAGIGQNFVSSSTLCPGIKITSEVNHLINIHQENRMVGGIEQVDRFPIFFLLYAILCFNVSKQYFICGLTQDAFRANFYGHVATAGHISVHLMFKYLLKLSDYLRVNNFCSRYLFFSFCFSFSFPFYFVFLYFNKTCKIRDWKGSFIT